MLSRMYTGFACGDRLELAALCPSGASIRHRFSASSRGQCIGVVSRGLKLPVAELAAEDGAGSASIQIREDDKVEQAWGVAGPDTPVVPTDNLVSLKIPSKFINSFFFWSWN